MNRTVGRESLHVLNILLTNSSNMYGGGEFYVLELAKELAKRGHNVIVTCKPDNLLKKKCDDAGVKTLPYDFPEMGKLAASINRLKRVIQREKIHIVHTNTNYDRTAGAFAARLAGAKHVTNVHSFHSLSHNLTHWVRNKWATDHFLVDGLCVKELLVLEDKISPKKISVVYLGVDPESMKKNESQRRRVRGELSIEDHHLVIGNVGRLVPMKGQTYLLDAFALVVKKFPDARLLLVGDGELDKELRAKSKEHNIIEQVLFAGFRDDLVAMYSAFDMYAHSSIEGGGETFPFAVLQALAQELPVVVTKVGDVPAMVDEGVNGFVVPEKNPPAFANKLTMLLSNEILRVTMGQASRKRLLERFTIEKMVDGVEKIYNGLFM
ncbi:MAG: glycosyltransferase family 1 protein [Bacteroidetes bacterium]|nr:MAG: glycosyltransferase family 1 protein [Bacteroidota bacterium]